MKDEFIRLESLDIERLASVSISADMLGVTPLAADADHIAALEADLAAANERCAELEREISTAFKAERLAEEKLAASDERCAELAAAVDGSRNCPKCHGFGYIDTGGHHYETDSAEERALTDMWRRRKCDCRTVDPSAILAAVREEEFKRGWKAALMDVAATLCMADIESHHENELWVVHFRNKLTVVREKAKREGKVEALNSVTDRLIEAEYKPWKEDFPSRLLADLAREIAALEGKE